MVQKQRRSRVSIRLLPTAPPQPQQQGVIGNEFVLVLVRDGSNFLDRDPATRIYAKSPRLPDDLSLEKLPFALIHIESSDAKTFCRRLLPCL
jgi:hypothetical protein